MVADRFFGRTALPEYGPMAPSEEELHLFGDLTNAKLLDIGCGSGHSLQYMSQRNTAELWGIDLSSKQIDAAKTVLKDCPLPGRLFESPMEHNPGLPTDYFDIVYSIYALGWSTDLNKTLANIYKYLKQGGTFIFSWEHPLFSRVKNIDGVLTFQQSYHEEGPYDHEAWHQPAIMQQFRISTYINALINHGFMIEKIVEDISISEEDIKRDANRWYSIDKAKSLPTTLIIKSKKL
ncbi:hypothetical protein J6TS2_22000 [Heyndrickxia sporothermodurans]|nr:hypothetical protein J6TS2_22000 [Heyndrickxia sporothermodurans]